MYPVTPFPFLKIFFYIPTAGPHLIVIIIYRLVLIGMKVKNEFVFEVI